MDGEGEDNDEEEEERQLTERWSGGSACVSACVSATAAFSSSACHVGNNSTAACSSEAKLMHYDKIMYLYLK